MVQTGQSWRWHKEHSLKLHSCIGIFKTLGIGPCERSWGDVNEYQDRKEIASQW
jgi:hypothetical protein